MLLMNVGTQGDPFLFRKVTLVFFTFRSKIHNQKLLLAALAACGLRRFLLRIFDLKVKKTRTMVKNKAAHNEQYEKNVFPQEQMFSTPPF